MRHYYREASYLQKALLLDSFVFRVIHAYVLAQNESTRKTPIKYIRFFSSAHYTALQSQFMVYKIVQKPSDVLIYLLCLLLFRYPGLIDLFIACSRITRIARVSGWRMQRGEKQFGIFILMKSSIFLDAAATGVLKPRKFFSLSLLSLSSREHHCNNRKNMI